MIPWYVDQGSAEWWALRYGKPTASQFHRIITPMKLEYSKQSSDYKMELLAERLLKIPMGKDFRAEWAEMGKVEQDLARRQFQYVNAVELKPIGFVTSDDKRLGCSPDALFADRPQAVEIKCPNPAEQLSFRYVVDKDWEAKYRLQVQGQLMIGEFELVHLYVYHRRLEAVHRKTEPDDKVQKVITGHLNQFCDELDAVEERARAEGVVIDLAGPTPKVVVPGAPGRDAVTILDAG